MQRSNIKTRFLIIIFAVFLFLSANIALNISISRSKSEIEKAPSKYFTQELRIGKILFIFPNFLLIKDISFSQPISKKEIFRSSFIRARFSFKELAVNKKLVITEVCVCDLKSDKASLAAFIKEDYSRIAAFLKDLPLQNIIFNVKNIRLSLFDKDKEKESLASDITFRLKDNSLRLAGFIKRIREPSYDDKGTRHNLTVIGSPLEFDLNGFLKVNGFSLEKLVLKRQDIYSQLWGGFDSGILSLHGFTFINTVFKESPYREVALSAYERFKVYLQSIWTPPQIQDLPGADLFILDIDCKAQIALPRIDINRLCFTLNNLPVDLSGNVLFSDDLPLEFQIQSHPTNLEGTTSGKLEKIDLDIKVKGQKGSFDGVFDLAVLKGAKSDVSLERAKLDFTGLNFSLEQPQTIKMVLSEADFFIKTNTNDYSMPLSKFESSFSYADRRFKHFDFSSDFFEGKLTGNTEIDTENTIPIVTTDMSIEGLPANRLKGLLVHFSKVFGLLRCKMRFVTYPNIGMNGAIFIDKGSLKEFEFFKWLSDLFNLPSLREIDFDNASANFTVDKKGAGLSDIILDSANVGLRGHFNLGKKDMVNSKLSLSLKKEVLLESGKLAPLVRLVGEDLDEFVFDFQLSGNLHKMNFQWLQSDFKKRLQDSIPNFIETKIEKDLEAIIDSINVK